ncbi:MAG: hypothetical protein AAF845_00940 [Bacteroidota bacterium]
MADDSSTDGTPTDGKPSYSLDLSTGKAPRRRKRKGPPPVVQQTINLSTPKPEAPPEAEAKPQAASGPKGGRKKGTGGTRDRRPPKAAGTSLADLLDPDTLARLRGDDG